MRLFDSPLAEHPGRAAPVSDTLLVAVVRAAVAERRENEAAENTT